MASPISGTDVIAFLDILRNGAFITKERLWLVPCALLMGYLAAIGFLFATAHGLFDYQGRVLGTDFSNVYAAGKAVLSGHATAPFDPARQYAQEQAIFGRSTLFFGWHYPPYFLLVAAPLAYLPYLWALAAWQLGTLVLYLGAIGMLLRAGAFPNWRWLMLAAAFPAAFVNLTHGNNGFLTAALLAAGLSQLERRAGLAGVLFGLLVYKPQFAMLIPLALAAGGYWRTLIAGALTAAILTLVVTFLFGADVWSAFLASTHFARTVVLEQGNTGFNKIQSPFAWARLWGGSISLAYVVQGFVSVTAAIALAVIWHGRATFSDKGAFLCLAMLLATPYCLDYDLVALAPAIALLATQGLELGFAPYERTLLAALWLVPIIAREVAGLLFLPLGTFAMLAAAIFVAFRALQVEGAHRNAPAMR